MSSASNKITISNGAIHGVEQIPSMQEQLEENERKARVNAAWEKMNSGLPAKIPQTYMNSPTLAENKKIPKAAPGWMMSLGLAPKKMPSASHDVLRKRSASVHNAMGEDAKKLAAAALSAVKDGVSAAATAGRGKVEITEVRDFAGEEITVKKFVDADSKEAAEKVKLPGAPTSALDTVLEQIKKKPKLNVLDKSKKDWGEFKEERRLEVELDAYKKSSNQYLDRVSFLQRADLREFEHERDARLASQSRRRSDMREDDSP